MRIQALNVSEPKTIVYRGEEVLTGIYKVSTTEPLMVRKLNIDGDRQADLSVHGGVDKAVYAFPAEHYSFYQEILKHEPYEPGQFGENLTTEGLLEADVHIGDRYWVGEVILEVSQPRSPCYKFAIKMGTAEALSVCIDSAKTGFYFRVLSEGMVRAGDQIQIDYSSGSAPTVEEVHRLYYLDKRNVDGMTRAVRCGKLAREWRDEFAKRVGKFTAKTH